MSPRPISPELRKALKRLYLGQLAETLPERVALGEAQSMPFEDLLQGDDVGPDLLDRASQVIGIHALHVGGKDNHVFSFSFFGNGCN